MIGSINNLPILLKQVYIWKFYSIVLHVFSHAFSDILTSETCLCCAVEVKVELSLLEKEKEMDGLSPNGKASPFADCRPNGALGHGSDDDSTPLPLYHKSRDYVEASVCHVKDLENGQ